MDKKTFSEMRQAALVSLGLPPRERKYRDDVDQWIAVIVELGWTNGKEWLENVPTATERDDEDEDPASQEEGLHVLNGRDGVTAEALLAEDETTAGLLPGLGTMMQDRVHWLSEDRKEDYMLWKADIMQRIKELERKGKAAVR